MTKEDKMIEAGWNFDNSYANLPESFFSNVNPTPVQSPKLIVFNESLSTDLGLHGKVLQSEGVEVFGGNSIPEGASPIAQAYAGHQFGHFTMLGDGRAVLLGEQITPTGERFDIQLKGSGRTPYSRGGDGRATIGPMLREYIISEAMHALGIPTTRSLAVVTTGESVIRETLLPGAILTRISASHIRVGTFEYVAKWGTVEELKTLANYTLKRHYPDVRTEENRYISLLQEVVKRQAKLIAKWQHVGFIHGVMNTDNMTISGETIDYGPCAFMDTYDPETVFSSIDTRGRYAYENQPLIAGWNLARFAETLLPLLHDKEDEAVKLAQDEISVFNDLYQDYWLEGMRAKLGIFNEESEDKSLINELLNIMKDNQADFTNTFRILTSGEPEKMDLFKTQGFKDWYERWQERQDRQEETKEQSIQLMRNHNPYIIPRNHRVEEALKAAVEQDDYSVMDQLVHALSNPFDYNSKQDEFTQLPKPSTRPYRTFCGT